jgi:hypothetical protein
MSDLDFSDPPSPIATPHTLSELAHLIRARNELEQAITAIVHRPASIGHLGEFIAAAVFDIVLEQSAVAKAIDGFFRTGPLAGKSVNVKWYAAFEGELDITPSSLPDTYLVLAGPRPAAMTSRGRTRPWLIERAFLFDAVALTIALHARGVRIGDATSVAHALWHDGELYPRANNPALAVSPAQRELLGLFGRTS